MKLRRLRDLAARRLAPRPQGRDAVAWFRDLIESAPDGILMTDAQGRIVFVNREIEHLFGYDRDELLGQSVEVLVPERLRDRHIAERDQYQRSPLRRPMGLGLELAARRKDGSEVAVE